MKKLLTTLCIIISITSLGQKWSFKAGIVAPLPVDVSQTSKVMLGSALAECAYKASSKVSITATSGYLRFNADEDFTNIPVLLGACYQAGKSVYFGASAGPGFFSESMNNSQILWSPYVGLKTGKVSADLRYFDWRKKSNNINSLGIVLSYNL